MSDEQEFPPAHLTSLEVRQWNASVFLEAPGNAVAKGHLATIGELRGQLAEYRKLAREAREHWKTTAEDRDGVGCTNGMVHLVLLLAKDSQ